MESLSQLLTLARQQQEYLAACRRHFHRHPELTSQETATIAFVEAEAARLGLPCEAVTYTGRVFTLDTGRPGPTVALRADIDALPVPEEVCNLKGERAVISENPGVSHACGHDAHMAMLLGAMRLLCGMKDRLRGKVLFCFEEGEEAAQTWVGMVQALEKKQVNATFAIHVLSSLDTGVVSLASGPRLAGMAGVEVDFLGRGGHGSRPDLSVNPVFAAAAALNNLAVAFANQIDANETVTLGITAIQGGTVHNVFPDTARVMGSLRFFNYAEGEKALALLKDVCAHTAAMNRCAVRFNPHTRMLAHPTVNDADATAMARAAFESLLPAGSLVEGEKWYASETYSEYLKRFKGCLAFLGIRNEALGSGAEHHNGHFDLDEAALPLGAAMHAAFALAAMENPETPTWHK